MANPKEIRAKIAGIRTTQKITNAMQQVATSKMYKARKRMEASAPYTAKVLTVMGHIVNSYSESYGEERHPYLCMRPEVKRIGYIVVSTDRGLCGGLNLNLFRLVLDSAQNWDKQSVKIDWCLFGKKADAFFRQLKFNVVAKISPLGENRAVASLIGGIKVMLDSYLSGRLDRVFLCYNEFQSSLVQRPRIIQLVPFCVEKPEQKKYNWDYIYEPNAKQLLDILLTRYLEAQVYQAVVDNLACEQVARMVAMKNATTNAAELLDELQLIHNKVRQGAITKEVAEIVEAATMDQNVL